MNATTTHDTAENAYVIELDKVYHLLKSLTESAQREAQIYHDNGDFHPDWGHVGSLKEMTRLLTEARDFMDGLNH